MDDAAQISKHLEDLGLPTAAQAWLLDLWHVIQVLDDAADGHKNANVADTALAIFARMPANDFYRQVQATMTPILALQVLKWNAANVVERVGRADARSWMWRAGYYEVVAMACHLCGLGDSVPVALSCYGEGLEAYLFEFPAYIPTEADA